MISEAVTYKVTYHIDGYPGRNESVVVIATNVVDAIGLAEIARRSKGQLVKAEIVPPKWCESSSAVVPDIVCEALLTQYAKKIGMSIFESHPLTFYVDDNMHEKAEEWIKSRPSDGGSTIGGSSPTSSPKHRSAMLCSSSIISYQARLTLPTTTTFKGS